jgi:hypothetical protein
MEISLITEHANALDKLSNGCQATSSTKSHASENAPQTKHLKPIENAGQLTEKKYQPMVMKD